ISRLRTRQQRGIIIRRRSSHRGPLIPRQPLIPTLNTRITHPPKRGTISTGRRRSTSHNNLRITRRRRRNRRQQSLQLLIRQLLRLIQDQIINSKTTTRPTTTGHKLNRRPISKKDRLLTIRPPDPARGNQRRQLRPAPLVLKERLQAEKRLPSRLHLISRMKNLTPQNGHLEKLNNLKNRVLTILATNRHSTTTSS